MSDPRSAGSVVARSALVLGVAFIVIGLLTLKQMHLDSDHHWVRIEVTNCDGSGQSRTCYADYNYRFDRILGGQVSGKQPSGPGKYSAVVSDDAPRAPVLKTDHRARGFTLLAIGLGATFGALLSMTLRRLVPKPPTQ